MSLGSDYLGSSGTRAPSSWRRACTPGTFLKTLRARNSRQKQKIRKMKTLLKNRMAIWAKAVLTLALLTTAACTTKTFSETPQLPPDVEVAAVEQRDVPISR